MTLADEFKAAAPKAVDFDQRDYESRREVFDQAAADAGYRLAGMRLERAVFTTKPLAPDAQK